MSKTKKTHSSEEFSSSSYSSSSLSSDEEIDARDLKPIKDYLTNRRELARQLFKSVKPDKVRMMLPQVLKKMDLGELEEWCASELSGMSKTRILCILNGKSMLESSDTNESDESGPSLEIISDTEEWLTEDDIKKEEGVSVKTKVKKHKSSSKIKSQSNNKKDDAGSTKLKTKNTNKNGGNDKYKDVKVKKEEEKETGKEKEADSLLDLLELEMRARAIRALIRKEDDIIPNSNEPKTLTNNSIEENQSNKSKQDELNAKENCRRQLEKIINSQQMDADEEDVVLVVQPTPTIELLSSESENEEGGTRVNQKLENERKIESEKGTTKSDITNNITNLTEQGNKESREITEGKDTNKRTTNTSEGKDTNKRTTNTSEGKDTNKKTSNASEGKDINKKTSNASEGKDTNKKTSNTSEGKDTNKKTSNTSEGKDTNKKTSNTNEGKDINKKTSNTSDETPHVHASRNKSSSTLSSTNTIDNATKRKKVKKKSHSKGEIRSEGSSNVSNKANEGTAKIEEKTSVHEKKGKTVETILKVEKESIPSVSHSKPKIIPDEDKLADFEEIIDLDNYSDDMDDLENCDSEQSKHKDNEKMNKNKDKIKELKKSQVQPAMETNVSNSQRSKSAETWATRYYQTDDVQNVIKESKIQSEIRKRLRERQRLSKLNNSPNNSSSPSRVSEGSTDKVEPKPTGSVEEYLALKQATQDNLNSDTVSLPANAPEKDKCLDACSETNVEDIREDKSIDSETEVGIQKSSITTVNIDM